LGEWVIPEDHALMVSISLAHASESNYSDAGVFNPDRFVGKPPDTYTWVPFGGGFRRCIGAAFANMEMSVTLRILLQEFELGVTYDTGEPERSRGVAIAPGRGGEAVVYRRPSRLPSAVSGDAAWVSA
jgi:cytochrome P450